MKCIALFFNKMEKRAEGAEERCKQNAKKIYELQKKKKNNKLKRLN